MTGQLKFSQFPLIFESLFRKNFSEFFETILSKFQCGFRADYGS